MTPRERVMAAVKGEAVDRIPYTLWYHFYLKPPAGADSPMGKEELAFYNRYQPDIMKVMHDVDYEPVEPLNSPDDWTKLTVLDPYQGNFGMQLDTLKEIKAGLNQDAPIIDTVFSVYFYAHAISGGRLLTHLREKPEPVLQGLKAIADSLEAYMKALLEIGMDGAYYAISGASGEGATREEYSQYFLPLDRQILTATSHAPLNIIHLHGYEDLYFDMTHDLPAAAVCWSDRSGGPSLTDAMKIHKGCLMGGLDETKFNTMTREEIVAQGKDAIARMQGHGFILSPGCSIPEDTDPFRIDAIGRAVG